ncbi:MAG: hypothetical protein IPL22_04935 [Bacteroidetes bacterium]|nr:hypothetical protein [Bacteroidota bacterium]
MQQFRSNANFPITPLIPSHSQALPIKSYLCTSKSAKWHEFSSGGRGKGRGTSKKSDKGKVVG